MVTVKIIQVMDLAEKNIQHTCIGNNIGIIRLDNTIFHFIAEEDLWVETFISVKNCVAESHYSNIIIIMNATNNPYHLYMHRYVQYSLPVVNHSEVTLNDATLIHRTLYCLTWSKPYANIISLSLRHRTYLFIAACYCYIVYL